MYALSVLRLSVEQLLPYFDIFVIFIKLSQAADNLPALW